MQFRTLSVFLGLALATVEAGAAPVVFSSILASRNRLVIPPAGFKQTQDLAVAVDEVVLNGPWVTGGYSLSIDTRRLVFGPGGRIQAFDGPAAPGFKGRAGPHGVAGASTTHLGGNGGHGQEPVASGGEGAPGADGHSAPGAIKIFAAMVSGLPRIDAKGEQGGMGGEGGAGGVGGSGGNGGPGDAGFKRHINGGNGGDAGDGGDGGVGGDGGKGGNGAEIVFLSGLASPRDFQFDVSPGAGGAPGRGGVGGKPGRPGQGGEGDSYGVIIQRIVAPGRVGKSGKLGQNGKAKDISSSPGNPGGIAMLSFEDLERRRIAVFRAFEDFQLARALYVILAKSNDLLFSGQVDPGLLRQIEALLDRELIAPLRIFEKRAEESNDSSQAMRLGRYRAQASAFQDYLKSFEDGPLSGGKTDGRIAGMLEAGKSLVENSLSESLAACRRYNQLKNKKIEIFNRYLLGMTSRYSIPVCGSDMENVKQSPLSEIILEEPAGLQVPSALGPFIAELDGDSGFEASVHRLLVHQPLVGSSELKAWLAFQFRSLIDVLSRSQ